MLIDISALIPAAIMFTAMMLPLFLAVGVVFLQRRAEARAERRSPLNEKLLHQPGSQARRKADEIGEDIMARTTVLLMVGPIAVMVLLLPRVRWAHVRFDLSDTLILVGAFCVILWCIRDIARFRRARRSWLNGMLGEMAAAQALDRLRVRGCEVFHDLPGIRGNIDHVVVANNAVFAVETKWRSKRAQGSGSADVWFDGQSLQFHGGTNETAPIAQARACAAELAKYLSGRTGEAVEVTPVIALPGWYAKNRPTAAASDVLVINPKMSNMLASRPGPAILGPQRNRIINAIADRYPEPEA